MSGQNDIMALVCQGDPITALDGATEGAGLLLTTTYQRGPLIDVASWREITLLIDINYAATDGDGGPSILPLLSAAPANPAPALTDDVWFAPGVFDGTVSAVLPGGTVASGSDYSITPEWGQVVHRPLVLEPGDIPDNATDELRMSVTLKCGWAQWFHVAAADNSGASTKATVFIQAVRHA